MDDYKYITIHLLLKRR